MSMPAKLPEDSDVSTAVRQVVPKEESVQLDTLLKQLTVAQRLTPFGDAILEFCHRFSAALFRDPEARVHPELQALAYWMRKSELTRLKQEFFSPANPNILRVPRGLVFHIPPSNVDTIFIYSWLLSVLTGNANVVRLSERAADVSALICRIFNRTLEGSDPAFARSTVFLRYGHDRHITEAISAAADVRVIWGGDRSVNAIRSVPLPPHARELTFPDRYSLAAVSAPAYLALDENGRKTLAERFYNDTFWFDQMACSSPRLLIWTGTNSDCRAAGTVFYKQIQDELRNKQYALMPGARLNKLTFAYRAILDQPVSALRSIGDECTVLELEQLSSLTREHCGGGLLFQAQTDDLNDIAGFILPRDQTLTYYGYSPQELKQFAALLNGRGIDRLVPIGQALTFHRFWDGYDLLHEFTRVVHLPS